ncbi:ester cyclase [Nocardia sp. NBC_01327]|uniref:ester cyclase n=1 Tax=Nocardia sp. NBC_01327 TaxID=2903593 RepID=UPI002E15D29C|nr:ester cyclase [Nocardia sp. NBC_01327]
MSSNQTAANKAAFKRLHDVVGTGDAELISKTIDELVRPDALLHIPLPVESGGAQGFQQVMTTFLRAYPDIELAVQDMIAEADKVVGRTVVTGTHRGEFMGLAPTGRSVEYDEIFIFRFVEGQVAEVWGVADVLTQMKQLGVLER